MKNWRMRASLLLLLPLSSSLSATEITHSMGIGLQYSGPIGYQVTVDNNKHRFRGAIGLVGMGVGYDYFIQPK
ncbi:MAG: hypothetical protein ACJASB_003632 [Shewanella psychromarinicola]|jgi:hypothetical protein